MSTLDRLSPGDAARVARRAKQTAVGTDVTALSRSTATRVQPRLPAVVHADLGARLMHRHRAAHPGGVGDVQARRLDGQPEVLRAAAAPEVHLGHPDGSSAATTSPSTIALSLPRGLRHTIGGIVERAGSRLVVTDDRNPGRRSTSRSPPSSTHRQAAAVSALLAHDDGVLVAPPGSGKTVMACAVIAERGTSTLILVDRKALADQWRTRIEQFLGFRPGQLGGGAQEAHRRGRHRDAAVAGPA